MIAFIDCFINDPVNDCVNQFVVNSKIPCTYHMPTIQGFEGLERIKKDISKVIILGSASHVHENLKWHQELLDFVIPMLSEGIPVLGICFGHQLLAHHFGADIGYIPQREESLPPLKEVRELTFISDELGHNENSKIKLAYAHSQLVKDIPDCLESFLTSSLSKYEGIRHKELPFIGLQSHPESTIKFIKEDCKVEAEKTVKEVLLTGYQILLNFISK